MKQILQVFFYLFSSKSMKPSTQTFQGERKHETLISQQFFGFQRSIKIVKA